jgi:hypothetical protein
MPHTREHDTNRQGVGSQPEEWRKSVGELSDLLISVAQDGDTFAVLHEVDDYDYSPDGMCLDIAMVDHGRAVIGSDADVRNLGPGVRAEIVTADRENEGGDIDADLADLVVRPPCSERSSMDDPTLRS